MIINFKKALCSGGGGGSSTTIEALNIIENGIYEAPKGTAYTPVTVDVPQPKVEAKKTVEITSNGNTEIVPSQGFDGIAGATVQVNVPTGAGGPIRLADHPDMRLSRSTFDTFTNEDYDFSGVTNASYMFDSCRKITSLPNGIDFSSVQNASSMFNSCGSLTSLPNGIDFSSVQNAYYMFRYCKSLTSLPNGIDFSSVQDASSMLSYCESLTSLPNGIDFSSVTNASSMFESCESLTSLPNGIDFSSVTNVSYMFISCSSLTSLPELDFGNVTYIPYFFGYSTITKLTDLGGFKNLKIDWNDGNGLVKCPNLTKQSVLNVINDLYDFRANGDASTTKTIKFNSNSLALLTPEETAIATNKGWNLVS